MLRQAVGVLNARIYIDGMYMGTGLTRASARDDAQRMLVVCEKAGRRKSPVKVPATLSPMGLPPFNER